MAHNTEESQFYLPPNTKMSNPAFIVQPQIIIHTGWYAFLILQSPEGWVDLGGLLYTNVVCWPEDGHPSSTNRVQHRDSNFFDVPSDVTVTPLTNLS